MRVFAYFNLHHKCWSLRATSGSERGRVVAHADTVTLSDCEFRVSEAGRQRVIQEGRKNVHAGCVGQLDGFMGTPTDAGVRAGLSGSQGVGHDALQGLEGVTYNPYRAGEFIVRSTGEPIHRADRVVLSRGAWALPADASLCPDPSTAGNQREAEPCAS